jgi:hypothetical protein
MNRDEQQSTALPDGFAELAPLVKDWSFATEYQRRERRAGASIAELRTYYELVGPRVRDIIAHLNQFPYGPASSLPPPQRALLQLALIFMEVALAVEFYGQPEVERGFPRNRWMIAS